MKKLERTEAMTKAKEVITNPIVTGTIAATAISAGMAKVAIKKYGSLKDMPIVPYSALVLGAIGVTYFSLYAAVTIDKRHKTKARRTSRTWH